MNPMARLTCIAIRSTLATENPAMAGITSKARKSNGKTSPLMVRLDRESKAYLAKAAELRRISVSDYVRDVAVRQARTEVVAAREEVIRLSPADQLAFWKALHAPVKLTKSQKHLSAIMRGKA